MRTASRATQPRRSRRPPAPPHGRAPTPRGAPPLGGRVDARVEALAVGPRPLGLRADEFGDLPAVVTLVGVEERTEVAAGQILLVQQEHGAAPLFAPARAHRSAPSCRATSETVTSTERTSRPVIRA